MHALRMLWTHGLPSSSSSRWQERPHLPPSCMPRQLGGASRPSVIERLERLVGRLRRGRYLSEDAPSFAQMVKSAEKRLFRAIVTNQSHVLHHALEPTTLSYHGRTLGTFWPVSCTLTSTVPNSLRLRL